MVEVVVGFFVIVLAVIVIGGYFAKVENSYIESEKDEDSKKKEEQLAMELKIEDMASKVMQTIDPIEAAHLIESSYDFQLKLEDGTPVSSLEQEEKMTLDKLYSKFQSMMTAKKKITKNNARVLLHNFAKLLATNIEVSNCFEKLVNKYRK